MTPDDLYFSESIPRVKKSREYFHILNKRKKAKQWLDGVYFSTYEDLKKFVTQICYVEIEEHFKSFTGSGTFINTKFNYGTCEHKVKIHIERDYSREDLCSLAHEFGHFLTWNCENHLWHDVYLKYALRPDVPEILNEREHAYIVNHEQLAWDIMRPHIAPEHLDFYDRETIRCVQTYKDLKPQNKFRNKRYSPPVPLINFENLKDIKIIDITPPEYYEKKKEDNKWISEMVDRLHESLKNQPVTFSH